MSDFTFAAPGPKSDILSGTNGGAGRPFGVNAGSWVDSSRDTLEADMAVIAAGVAPALDRQAQYQAQSASFIVKHGAEVLPGHNDVGTGIVMDLEPPNPG